MAITVLQDGLGLPLALGVAGAIKSRNVLRVLLSAPTMVALVDQPEAAPRS